MIPTDDQVAQHVFDTFPQACAVEVEPDGDWWHITAMFGNGASAVFDLTWHGPLFGFLATEPRYM